MYVQCAQHYCNTQCVVHAGTNLCLFFIMCLARVACRAIAGATVTQLNDVASRALVLEHSMKRVFVSRHATSDYASRQSSSSGSLYKTCSCEFDSSTQQRVVVIALRRAVNYTTKVVTIVLHRAVNLTTRVVNYNLWGRFSATSVHM